VNHTDKGYLGEQLAMAWLLKNGYWVFKNLAPQGPVDCVAINQKTLQVVLVDVKVLSKHKGGHTRSKILNDKQKQMGVKILYVDVNKFECRWKQKLDNYIPERNKFGQFVKLPKTKI